MPDTLRCFPEGMASFPGDLNTFIASHLIYPTAAKEEGQEGRVVTQFTVRLNGCLDNIRIVRSSRPDMDQEAFRLISIMPCWLPAKVEVIYTLPITFKLD
jgi:protein TonB